ncbi:MAG: siroheme synthase CysG [Pseudomonadota bacterium]
MRHFPVFLDTRGRKIIVSGAQDCAVAKLRLLLKTEADIHVFASQVDDEVLAWARQDRLTLHRRDVETSDLADAILLYAANDNPEHDLIIATHGQNAGVKTLVVDNLEASDFITPAIVDRSPITVAIGTEGTAPVLARRIKADIEETLPQNLGVLARIAKPFRPLVERLPLGRPRRAFWSRYYFEKGPKLLTASESQITQSLHDILDDMAQQNVAEGHVHFVGAGPGDPELLTLKARKILHEADVVVYDRLVSAPILELARREAKLIEAGKTGFGPSWKQEDINDLLIEHGASQRVVRLKSGDAGVFGRLDEETEALLHAGIEFSVTPGITSAAAAASELKLSLTRRGRNSGLRIITGHQAEGFAEQDWRDLAKPGVVAAIYMGKKASAFLTGRLMMHGAAAATPVTIVENVSRPDQVVLPTTLLSLSDTMKSVNGTAVIMLGLAPQAAPQTFLKEARS